MVSQSEIYFFKTFIFDVLFWWCAFCFYCNLAEIQYFFLPYELCPPEALSVVNKKLPKAAPKYTSHSLKNTVKVVFCSQKNEVDLHGLP